MSLLIPRGFFLLPKLNKLSPVADDMRGGGGGSASHTQNYLNDCRRKDYKTASIYLHQQMKRKYGIKNEARNNNITEVFGYEVDIKIAHTPPYPPLKTTIIIEKKEPELKLSVRSAVP